MKWRRLSKARCVKLLREREQRLEEYDALALPDDELILRRELKAAFLKCKEAMKSYDPARRAYVLDLLFGIQLYNILSRHGFSLWEASDNEVWAHISFMLVPEIVLNRWGNKYNADRFYKRDSRIWLKVIWWYVFLSMVPAADGTCDEDKTEELLGENVEDNIPVLLDRKGKGFRIDLTRRIMWKFREVCLQMKGLKIQELLLRIVMREHTVRSQVVDPLLEGVEKYVDDLFASALPMVKKMKGMA